MRGKRVRAWALASVAVLAIAVPAEAQTTAPPPSRQSVDANGVDLFLGKLNISTPSVSMGDGETGLSYYFINNGGGWSDNVTAALDQSGSTVTVRLGAATDDFSASGTTYTSLAGRGATLVKSGTTYTYTATDGTVAHFYASTANATPFYASLGRVADVRAPSGKALEYTYDSVYYCNKTKAGATGLICTGHGYAYRLANITNSYGYQIQLAYDGLGPEDEDDTSWNPGGEWSQVLNTALVNLKSASSPSLSLATTTTSTTFAVTDPASRTTSYRTSGNYVLGITRAGSASENVTVTYSGVRVATVTTAVGTWTYGAPSDVSGLRTVTVTNPSSQTTTYVFNLASQRMTSVTDALSHTTSWTYDSAGRVLTATAPEGNSVQYGYDGRGNVTTTTIHAKTGTGQPDIATSASYDATCSNGVTCNQPNTTTDALGHVTSYAYDATHGGVTSVTLPAPTTGAVQPQVRTSYTGYTDQFGGTVYRATGTSTCRTTASCANTADETVTSTNYGSLAANNLLPMSTTTRAGDSSISATTSVTYDAVGNVVSATDPMSAVSTFQYDADRWRTMAVGPDPDGSGPLHNRAQQTNYNADGTVASVEVGTATAAFGSFTSLQQVATSYDAAGRAIKTVATAGGNTYGVTQTSYDAANRAVCTVTRMNPSVYASLPSSACTLGTTGSDGPDRITRTVADVVGRTASVTTGYGTSVAATEATATYTDNGRTATATDANGNKTSYTYDAYDRPSITYYPSPTSPGTSSTTDYEQLTHDDRGLVTAFRNRDGQTIYSGYDALGRITSRDRPNTAYAEFDQSYAYDLMGHIITAADSNGYTLGFSFDALGRQTAQSNNWYGFGNASYLYDAAGRRTRLTWNDSFYVTYDYDVANEPTAVRENGSTALASFGYDDLGRRTSLTRANGVVTSYTYNAGSQLTGLGLDLNGTANDLSVGLTYNPAGQIGSRSASNDAYAWPGAVNVDRPYTTNGLNQYTASGSVSLGYDGKGNLTSSGSTSYGYTSDNLLATATGVSGIYYDAVGRLFNVANEGSINTTFAFAGADLFAEINQSTGALMRRYVFGPGTDEPLVWYEGSGTSDRRYLVADERGSVVAVTDGSGNALTINAYDEYGIPSSTTPAYQGRFGYTGQAWLPSLGMWYYKARMYSPTLGRFLQTDPIGYGDGMNWYNYARNDPINLVDPSGKTVSTCVWQADICYPRGGGGGGGGGYLGPSYSGSGGSLSGSSAGLSSVPSFPGDITVTARAAAPAGCASCHTGASSLPRPQLPSLWDMVMSMDCRTSFTCVLIQFATVEIYASTNATERPRRETAPTNAPAGTRPLSDMPKPVRDIVHGAKGSLGLGPRDWVGVAPDGTIISTNPETGEMEDQGNVNDHR